MSPTATSPSDKVVPAGGSLVQTRPVCLGVHTLGFALGRVIWHSASKRPWPSQGAPGQAAAQTLPDGLGRFPCAGAPCSHRAAAAGDTGHGAAADPGLCAGTAAWHECRSTGRRGRPGRCLPTTYGTEGHPAACESSVPVSGQVRALAARAGSAGGHPHRAALCSELCCM